MAAKQITLIQGHPDPAGKHFCHALADAYIKGAEASGHIVKIIEIAQIDFPILRSYIDFHEGEAPETIKQAQQLIQSAQHLVIIYPLWLGNMPAYLQAFFEQVFRPGFAADKISEGKPWKKRLGGKTAHIVITMGMPAFAYRWFFLAHGLKNLERNVLGFCGIKTTHETLIGMIEAIDILKRQQWLEKLEALGRAGK